MGTGKFTLPAAIVLTALLWLPTGVDSVANWGGYLVVVLTTLMLRVIVNSQTLIRVRSWFLSSLFCVFSGIFVFQHHFDLSMLGTLSFLIAQYFLFGSYQTDHPERAVFQSFLFLGVSSLFFPKMLCLTPFFFLAMIVQLRAFTPRSFLAALMGLLVPLEVMAVYCFGVGNPETVHMYFSSLTQWTVPTGLPDWSPARMVSICFVLLLFIVGTLHFSRTNFNDKIRVRMFFYILATQAVVFVLMLAFCPGDYTFLSRLMVLESVPFVAHYFVLGKGWMVDLVFNITLILMVALTAFNLWNPSSLSF